jgi:hypothetical protein
METQDLSTLSEIGWHIGEYEGANRFRNLPTQDAALTRSELSDRNQMRSRLRTVIEGNRLQEQSMFNECQHDCSTANFL